MVMVRQERTSSKRGRGFMTSLSVGMEKSESVGSEYLPHILSLSSPPAFWNTN